MAVRRVARRGTARAFAYDARALAVTEAGLANGQYDALEHLWEKVFFTLPLVHAEGPDHLARMDRLIALAERRLDEGPEHLRPIAAGVFPHTPGVVPPPRKT